MTPTPELAAVSAPPPVVLTIAGFDPSSGAGITADLQVFAAHALFGVSAITAQTVQSTQGVTAVLPQDAEWVAATVERLADDFSIIGVKIGMLATAEIAEVVAAAVGRLGKTRGASPPQIVLDPVLVSSSGHRLLSEDGVAALREQLLPLVDWVTPNWAELAALTGLPVESLDAAKLAADQLAESLPGLSVVATGGDQERAIDFVRTADGATAIFDRAKIPSKATHGTGCAFSSALLAGLVLGAASQAAVESAKRYVEGGILHAPGLGKGVGPLNYFWQGLQK